MFAFTALPAVWFRVRVAWEDPVTEFLAIASISTRDELHDFIDEIEDELAKPGLHATIDTLPDDLIPVVLNRMRALKDGITVYPPQMD
jgi:hypothetical protein